MPQPRRAARGPRPRGALAYDKPPMELDDLVDRLRTYRIAWLDDPDSPYRVPAGPNTSPAPNTSPDTERLTQKVE